MYELSIVVKNIQIFLFELTHVRIWFKLYYKNTRTNSYVVTCLHSSPLLQLSITHPFGYYISIKFVGSKNTHFLTQMASVRLFLLAILIIVSLSSIDNVQGGGTRKLLTQTFPDLGKIPGLEFPPFPPVTEWPEYRLPPPIFNIPDFFSPPYATTTATTKP
ncbi:hypothetical protein MtrunA17_Chr4g0049961 [Medicago truncatula]|uniref:Leguminosin group485 secreted peptide n=2 Tax=Medicago truncatula TaxID=3880 RepID=A0A396IEI3_MEDTR|nr:hypothetical protein MtrunA17_Chr4g0049961 [Medicago truncatula]